MFIISHLPSPRSWYECHVGPLPLPLRMRLLDTLDPILWGTVAAVMNRIATEEMRHAAFLLGEQFAYGYGRQGALLGHMREFLTGEQIASGLLDASATQSEEFWALLEASQLEHLVIAGGQSRLDVTP
jgi:hypothetical protein